MKCAFCARILPAAARPRSVPEVRSDWLVLAGLINLGGPDGGEGELYRSW